MITRLGLRLNQDGELSVVTAHDGMIVVLEMTFWMRRGASGTQKGNMSGYVPCVTHVGGSHVEDRHVIEVAGKVERDVAVEAR